MNPKLPLAISAAVSVASGGAMAARERHLRQAMERFAGASLETLLNAIEANDADTGMHVRRVASYALIIAEEAGLPEAAQHAVERVALFHDIGKIHEALFDIVHDPSTLTGSDRDRIATHPARGAQVLAPLGAFYPELPAGVLAHHERWDGRGYPRGLRGTRIPIESRIVAIADTFDAIAHSRRYRRGTGRKHAMRQILAGRGTQFDPDFVDLLLWPPVMRRMERQRVLSVHWNDRHAGRRTNAAETIPDVSFRWRSQSLGTGSVGGAVHRID